MLKRGFKSWSEKVAIAYRQELNLIVLDPLCPRQFAEHMEVLVWTPEQVPSLPSDVLKRLKTDKASWSAVTICSLGHDLIILNSSHASTRQASDLMHELSHLVIGHTPARVDVTQDNQLVLNTYDRDQEDEANWLAGTLLLPREAIMYWLCRRESVMSLAGRYGVSEDMVNWRINTTGVKLQLMRTRR